MTNIRLVDQIEQSQGVLRNMRESLSTERTSTILACDKLLAKARRGKLKDGEIPYLTKRVEALKKQHEEFNAQQDRHIELLNSAIHGELEQMHGLLAYGLANNDGLGAEARLLHDSLGDYLNAKSDPDKRAAKRSVDLCLAHGSLIKTGPNTDILDQYEAITDPEESSKFYRENQKAIWAQIQARQDNSNQT